MYTSIHEVLLFHKDSEVTSDEETEQESTMDMHENNSQGL